MAKHKITCASIRGFDPCNCGIEQRREEKLKICPACHRVPLISTNEPNCDYCGATLTDLTQA